MGIFSSIFGSNQDSQNQLASIINDNAFLVDVRSKDEYESGHVEGSVNIPLDQVQANMAQFKNQKNIVVFCRSGNRSGQAKVILERNGIQNVTNGGTWQEVRAMLN
ncbi:sulfurtransferase [Flavobacterium branchiophilum]|uniref:Rhodanese-related sulfurtransferase n=1 Tax=Flavobacterium branchiophilum TaxID=55197 RepID=A0A543G6D1_9FLAO|nr:rhodanese-like domain-containing protein [Flavobacterium branchiophilum]OXA66810.1 sulfurtransferase [Flavobacterium branchiophilum] [Flavobacterium branchiophilum NBRC 15030 = ATCC 35035]TQM41650.1 rhodanese-related sulfurtransferase [Flavobacterium branchiophilum]GEM56582.1 sulfurtransferase [Flavobacterium branchiophilum NBRC 15030 = ATCC 35035]